MSNNLSVVAWRFAGAAFRLLFSFGGRTSRTGWWLGSLCVVGAALATLSILDVSIFTERKPGDPFPVWLVYIGAVAGYAHLALATKRLKDRAWSNWAIFIILALFTASLLPAAVTGALTKFISAHKDVAAANAKVLGPLLLISLGASILNFGLSLFLIFENGFRAGTPGPNFHGADPRGLLLWTSAGHHMGRLLPRTYARILLIWGLFGVGFAYFDHFGWNGLQSDAIALVCLAIGTVYGAYVLFVVMRALLRVASAGPNREWAYVSILFMFVVCAGVGFAVGVLLTSSAGVVLSLVRETYAALGVPKLQAASPLELVPALIIFLGALWFLPQRLGQIWNALYRPAWLRGLEGV